MRFDDWKTGRKLNLAFGSVVLSLVCVAAVVLLCLAQIRKAAQWDSHTAEVLGHIAVAAKAMVDQETGVRGYLLSGQEPFLEPFNNGGAAFEASVGKLAQLTVDNPAQQGRIQNLRQIAGGWRHEVAEREIALRREPATAAKGVALEASGAGKARMDAARRVLTAMADAEQTLQKTRAEATAQAHAWATLALLGGSVAAIALAAAMSWLMGRRVIRPLTEVTGAMREIVGGARDVHIPARGRKDEIGALSEAAAAFAAATESLRQENEASVQRDELDRERAERDAAQARADREQREVIEAISGAIHKLAEGDLTHRIGQALPGQAEHMREAFNHALDQLEQALLAVTAGATQISSSSGELYRSAQDLSRRTEQQAASLEESAAALDQITATVRRTAEGAQEASSVVVSAREAAETSGSVMIEAVEAMSSIETSAQQIAQIIGVIDEIAFQTNLLALNAGVEAARAGEAGRGFAVVASEVRALAQRSAEAAKEIKALITTSTGQVGRGVELVARTGEALKEIIGKFTEIAGLTRDIANSAQEQATGLGQVNTTVNHMDQMTQQNAAMVNETTSSSEALAQAAQELNRLVGRFKTRGEPIAPARLAAAPRAAARGGRTGRLAARASALAVAEAPADDWSEF